MKFNKNYIIDTGKPPLWPPGRQMKDFFGIMYETKESKYLNKLYLEYLDTYYEYLQNKRKKNDSNE